ncbi:MAG: zinc ribbon domain-containing protein [Chloroflexia bacterium]
MDHRFTEIGPQGKYTAVEAGVVEAGRIESHLKVGRQSGSVVQVELDALSGGDVSVSGEAERNDGEWVGLRIGSLGSAAPRSLSDPTPAADPPRDPAMEDASTTQCPNCGAQVEPGARFCLNCGARLQAQPSRCANCGAALLEDAAYCTQCGTKV